MRRTRDDAGRTRNACNERLPRRRRRRWRWRWRRRSGFRHCHRNLLRNGKPPRIARAHRHSGRTRGLGRYAKRRSRCKRRGDDAVRRRSRVGQRIFVRVRKIPAQIERNRRTARRHILIRQVPGDHRSAVRARMDRHRETLRRRGRPIARPNRHGRPTRLKRRKPQRSAIRKDARARYSRSGRRNCVGQFVPVRVRKVRRHAETRRRRNAQRQRASGKRTLRNGSAVRYRRPKGLRSGKPSRIRRRNRHLARALRRRGKNQRRVRNARRNHQRTRRHGRIPQFVPVRIPKITGNDVTERRRSPGERRIRNRAATIWRTVRRRRRKHSLRIDLHRYLLRGAAPVRPRRNRNRSLARRRRNDLQHAAAHVFYLRHARIRRHGRVGKRPPACLRKIETDAEAHERGACPYFLVGYRALGYRRRARRRPRQQEPVRLARNPCGARLCASRRPRNRKGSECARQNQPMPCRRRKQAHTLRNAIMQNVARRPPLPGNAAESTDGCTRSINKNIYNYENIAKKTSKTFIRPKSSPIRTIFSSRRRPMRVSMMINGSPPSFSVRWACF